MSGAMVLQTCSTTWQGGMGLSAHIRPALKPVHGEECFVMRSPCRSMAGMCGSLRLLACKVFWNSVLGQICGLSGSG